jgi:23S rRNA (uracil1939-C5)-methyltransferase
VVGEPAEIEIVRLGAQGDGIAETTEGGPRFVPFALPGERVRVVGDEMVEIVAGSHPQRSTPICRHFGTCGGCVAQHMSEDLYAEWKRGIVVEAFRQRGLAPEIAPLLRVPAGSRRRAVLTAKRVGETVTLGYHGRRSHALFDLEECPVLLTEIVAALPALRGVAGLLAGGEMRFTVLATPAGLDVAVDGKIGRADARAAAALARIAAQFGLARITLGGETIIERASPVLQTSGVDVLPPPGAFVQAVAAAEGALVSAVLDRIGKPKRAADLFCGVGTFTLAMARRSRVTAFDSDARSVAALQSSVRHAGGLKPVEARVRDLFREPLSPRELAGFDAVVLDPPRAGAKAQCEALAGSDVSSIAYVSCDPATLARDVRVLVDAGLRLGQVSVIDQFVFSAHVELVAALTR